MLRTWVASVEHGELVPNPGPSRFLSFIAKPHPVKALQIPRPEKSMTRWAYRSGFFHG